MKDVDFKVFSRRRPTCQDGRVAALRVPGGGTLTRGEIDDYTEFVDDLRRQGAGLDQGQRRRARAARGLQSPIVKNLDDAALAEIIAPHRRAQTAT